MRHPRTIFVFVIALLAVVAPPLRGQELAQRLILKDGSYQLTTKYEVKGDRVRYLSAERNEWEELPKDLVDWAATEQYEKDRSSGKPVPEAAALDKELEAERQAEEAQHPEVAPGLRLPEDGNILLLDTFQNQPQLVELPQSGGDVDKNTKSNMLHAAINPIANAKQSIELPGAHAKVQSHATLPAIYVNLNQGDTAANEPDVTWDRFKIAKVQVKGDKRIAGAVKIAVYGKISPEANLVPTQATQLSGGWVKVTPASSLAPGEYAVVEMLGKEGMNLYVWDFGVNPSAPANSSVWKPEPASTAPPPTSPKDLEKRTPNP
jgi:hypothetical protein